MSKVASLTSGLVAKKGQATPAVLGVPMSQPPIAQAVELAAPPVVVAVAPGQAQQAAAQPVVPTKGRSGTKTPKPSKAAEAPAGYYKALTVKLDRGRYETLKRVGLQFDKKSQEIFVEALDAYLAKMG